MCKLYVAEFKDPVATLTIFKQDKQVELAEQKLRKVKSFLKNAKLPVDMRLLPGQMHSIIWERKLKAFIRYAARFFLHNQQLMRKHHSNQHRVVPDESKRVELVQAAHDQIGHHSIYATHKKLVERFWWPQMDSDIKWFVRTCHQCQLRSMQKTVIPPVVPHVPTLFAKVHIDTKHMP